MHFTAIYRPKFQRFSPWCPPWGDPVEPLYQANSKETESLGKNGSRQKCLKKKTWSPQEFRRSR